MQSEESPCLALHAINSLSNAHGFSPCILVFGSNPKLPSVLNKKPPALEEFTSLKLIADNLNAMQRAREAFIRNKAFERIKGQVRSKNKLSSNERAGKMQNNEPSLTSVRQMVLEISHFKVRNLRMMDVAILKVSSLIFI